MNGKNHKLDLKGILAIIFLDVENKGLRAIATNFIEADITKKLEK